ncbi:aminopeptidase O isoform X1 [Etheostoma cragini]|uniref:aminopeptidase O isoform X1 n=1 Tax=Etheostoma cragini TaxID=417921 RepID=UPI00155F26F1|nr:aminopeptidase O isoform X1 [Etheostoma cragini]XP_034727515.1 aminopeptidase O isoform X1 [Etheostoma cragini]
MEPDKDLNPDMDDLPLRANTNHILVRHYVLDLTVHFDREVISGSVVLFLEPCAGLGTKADNDIGSGAGTTKAGGCRDVDTVEDGTKGLGETTTRMEKMSGAIERDAAEFQALSAVGSQTAAKSQNIQSSHSWETTSDRDFTLVLDCCDLDVSKVEEVDVTSVSSMVASESISDVSSVNPNAAFIQNLISVPSSRWRQKHQLFLLCSRAHGAQGGGSLHFQRDRWSLQVRKKGVTTPQEFPRALRICYETRPTGGSVRWTKDQDNRVCVYTAGSPINNRALFPCQEPPVAMSTWHATVRAPSECVVLMSGEEQAEPIEDGDTPSLIWTYYVTMPMPASTFTLAVGHWHQVPAEIPPALERGVRDGAHCSKITKLEAGPGEWTEADLRSGLVRSISEVVKGSPLKTGSRDQTTGLDSAFCYSSLEDEGLSVTDCSGVVDDGICCSHGDYPCRFTEQSARSQRVIPHRVFGPVSLLQKTQGVLKLLPRCLAAAHTLLGVHPFPRLDVLIVPAGFSSLGMASPHIIFLSQSVLYAGSVGSGENGLSLCGSRICHEIAHSWFGLVIGARDWTEEWISEGFATYLEDIIWAQAQHLSLQETAEQSDLKALLRWRRLSDELQNSEEALQILRPNMENTGQVSESGSSMVKHALNPDKTFMQVHYLKGYFLLRFLASQVGEQQFIDFFRLFVKKYHGQLILSQDFLKMLLITFPSMERKGLTLSAIYADWLDRPGIPKLLYERSVVWSQSRLVEEVKAEVVKWILLSQSHQGRGRKRKRIELKVNYKEVMSDQLVMLLELLLEEEALSAATVRALQRTYNLQNQDAEVQHRWCEMVVKHAYTQAYRDVEHFLVHDQAMGVYLYGELMVQEDPEQQALARRCLSLVAEQMDQSARRVVEEMVL